MSDGRAMALSARRFFSAHERVFTLIVAVGIGIVAGFGAIAVGQLIHSAQDAFAWFQRELGGKLGFTWLGIVLVPALGGLIVGPVIHRLAREAKGHGVPEVMAAVIQRGGFIRPRVALVKAFASAVTIASGGSVGKEGPIVQIGSSIGSPLGYPLRAPPRLMRTFVACGAAGGIAAAFNAPIAGALFAVEIILGDFGFVQLAPIVTSSVIATVISRGFEGNFAAFQVPHYALVDPIELLPYLALGLGCGVGAVVFIKVLDTFEEVFDNQTRIPEWLSPAVGGLGIGLLALSFPQILGMGYGAIDAALHDQLPILMLAALVAVKMVATSLTLASGGSGGIFAPSLFMGAMAGGMVGKVSNLLLPESSASSGAYALVGMAAMVGATTHAPITAIVIIFELTNDYKIILPLMISTIVSVLTASALYRESIYTDKLRRKGIDIHRALETNLLKQVETREVMRTQVEAAPQDLPFNFIADMVMQSSHSQLPVVDGDGRIQGVVARDTVKRFLFEKELLSDVVVAKDLVNHEFPALLQDETLDQAMLRFHEFNSREIYVVDSLENRRLIGMLLKEDLMDAYQQEMAKRSSGDIFAYNINRPHRMASVDVMDGYGILEVDAPHDYSGKLLRELDLRNRFGITVLAIKRMALDAPVPTVKVWVPESGDRIEDGDVLVVLGETDRIAEFHANS